MIFIVSGQLRPIQNLYFRYGDRIELLINSLSEKEKEKNRNAEKKIEISFLIH